jgi:hypothetical protein
LIWGLSGGIGVTVWFLVKLLNFQRGEVRLFDAWPFFGVWRLPGSGLHESSSPQAGRVLVEQV